ncbi:cystatin-like [Scyliorhinus canicula]|uniref:cystatin-like n=1 Tax=Scyliorhinus canicula TaxID=7830 RepID=UPI0018F58A2F|nr:cystatin-like [Scyliorhinus canicula]
MAGWQCLLAVFSVVFVSVSAFPSPNVKKNHETDQDIVPKPLVLKVDKSDQGFLAMAEFALQEFNKKTTQIYDIMEYLQANVQMIEGAVYIFDIVLGKTNCPVVTHETARRECRVIETEGQSEFFLCHFIAWKPATAEKQQLLKSKCQKLIL